MKKRVYTLLVEHFKNWGISHVFGIPGKSISPLMLELDTYGIEYVLGRRSRERRARAHARTPDRLAVPLPRADDTRAGVRRAAAKDRLQPGNRRAHGVVQRDDVGDTRGRGRYAQRLRRHDSSARDVARRAGSLHGGPFRARERAVSCCRSSVGAIGG